MKNIVLIISIILTLACGAVFAQNTEFTYQGSLKNGANPASGNYDFEFQLFDDPIVGTPASSIIPRNSVGMSNGIFSVKLDFGTVPFPLFGVRYLQISVRQTGGGAFTILTPRQAVTPSPYSIKSIEAINALNSTQLGGLPSSGFIQNTTLTQALSDFNISGTGTANRIRSTGNADFLGSVGIGITSPAYKLQVIDALNTGLRVQTNIAGGTVASFGGNGAFQIDAPFIVGGRFNVLENGNVGIGITFPTEKLMVNGNIQSTSGGFKFPDGSLQTTAVGTTFTNPRTAAVEIPINGTPASILHLDLPAGTYMVTATVQFRNNANVFGQNNSRVWFCRMFQDLNFDQAYVFTLAGADTPANILSTTVHSVVPLSSAGSVDFKCHGSAAGGQNFVFADQRRLTAVKIEGNVVVQ